MLLRRYKRNDELDLTEEAEQLEEQELTQEEPGEVRDETDVTVADEDEQDSYEGMTLAQLKDVAIEKGISGYSNKNKEELIELLKGE